MKSIWRPDFPTSRNPLKFFLYASRPHWRVALFATLMASVGTILATSVPYIFKRITNAAVALPDPQAYEQLLWAAVGYIAILGLSKLFWRFAGFGGSIWAMGSMSTARDSLTSYITLHSRAYFSDRFAGSL